MECTPLPSRIRDEASPHPAFPFPQQIPRSFPGEILQSIIEMRQFVLKVHGSSGEQLGDCTLRLIDGGTVIHDAREIGVGEGDAMERSAAKNLARSRSAIHAEEKSRLSA
jgi:hypothetical protein